MRLLFAVLLALLAVSIAGCAVNDRAKELYGTYREADERRNGAEERLRVAFSDLAAASEKGDRGAAVAAIARGRRAVAEIDHLLVAEIDAASELGKFEKYARDAARLEHGLETTRKGLRLFARELAIGTRDPFLARKENAREVSRLAREGGRLSVNGEMEAREASRALARSLGVEPAFDPLLEQGED